MDADDLADDTILIFTSDHGDMLWSQGKMKKQQPWEESISIPFIIRWPGRVPAGRVSGVLLSIVDMLPSLLGLAGIAPPDGVQGTDLSDAMRGGDQAGPHSVFLMDILPVDESRVQGIPAWRGLRTFQYTYAQLLDGTGWLLYDNLSDPYQLINLIDDARFQETRHRLEAEIDAWYARTGDARLSGKEYIRTLGIVDLWNRRERAQHPQNPDLLSV